METGVTVIYMGISVFCFGHPLSILHFDLVIWVRIKIRVTKDAYITSQGFGNAGMPETRGCPYHRDTVSLSAIVFS